jgi:hypothetical protein
MTVFISYARADQAAAEQLRADVERCHRDAWVDQELTGGQSWWRAILDHIRRCDVFVVVLSPQWIRSKACDLELRYAVELGRPVLPVMVEKIDPRLAPPAVADAQIVSFLQRSPEATFALRDALDTLPAAPPLPSPLPREPAAPISYLHNVILMLNAPTLEPRDQHTLWQQLRAVLDETQGDDRPELLDLAHRFRRRPDLVPQLGSEIDDLLGPATSPGPRTLPSADSSGSTAPARERSRRGLLWAAATAAAIVVASSVWIAVAGGQDPTGPATTPSDGSRPSGAGTATPREATFTMPSLVYSRGDDAELALRSVGWVGRLSRSDISVTDQRLDGTIVTQDPHAGTEAPTDASVTVTIGVFDPDPTNPSAPG